MIVSELIKLLQNLDQEKEIRFQELDLGYELKVEKIEQGEQGDWYVIS